MKWMSRSHLPSRPAKGARGWAVAGVVALLACAAAVRPAAAATNAVSTNAPPRRTDIPASFPKVNLSHGSEPRYMLIEMDSLKSQPAFLLFDGNLKDGYEHLFVWSPGDDKYGKKPISYRLEKETQDYTSFSSESQSNKVAAETRWTIKYRPETHGSSYRDYKTGKMIEGKPTLLPCFYFEVELQRGPANRMERKGGKWPLDISIPGRLYVVDDWQKLPPAEAPWTKVYCSISRDVTYGRKGGVLHCQGHLHYWHDRWNNFACTIKSLPDDTRVQLEVAPYLEKPIYAEDLKTEEIFLKPHDVDVPYGWYRILFTFKSAFFKADGLNQNSDAWPFAFPPPAVGQ
jgi:hypothetical protein